MIRTASFFVVVACAAAVLTAAACQGGPARDVRSDDPLQNDRAHADAGASCETLANAAATELREVIASHQACAVDSDCATIWRSTDCFDQCSDALATSGQDALKATKDKLNAGPCAQFLDAGCKHITPPCVPPGQPRCSSGKCTLSP